MQSLGKREECKLCLQQTSHRKRETIRHDGSKDISEIMNLLVNEVDCQVNSFEICSKFNKHLERVNISRNGYSNDSHLFVHEKGNAMQAVDMQKMIMLPRMPGVTRAAFTRRIVAVNMTFAPLGGKVR